MHLTITDTRPWARVSALLVVLLAIAASVGTLSPAVAHNRVLSTTPGSGDVVRDSPASISVVFNADLLARGATLSLADPSGQPVPLGPAEVDHARLSAPVPRLAVNGAYEVSYRVVTVDGHAVSSTYTFRYDPAAAPTLLDWIVGVLQGALVATVVLVIAVGASRLARRGRQPIDAAR